MKRTSTIFCILVFLLLVTNSAWSRERRSFFEGSRGRAMGGAQIAVVNDETALLVNPAGLGKLRDFYGTIIDPEFEYSNNLNAMNQSSAITQPFSLASVKDTLAASPETYYHAKSQLFPSFVARNFGVGIFSNYTLDAEMNAAGNNIDAFYRSDIALVMGYNLRFFDGRIKLGVSAKLLNRIELDNALIDPALGLDNTTLGTAEGTGLSTDLGLIMTAPWATLPTISAVLRDVGGTAFDKVSGVRLTSVNRPTTVAQDVDVAMAFFPIHSNSVRSAWTIEYRGLLTSSTETDKAKLLHAGMEINMSDIFFVRAGYNQRYYTAGFEVASERMQFQFTTYGEEIGNETTPREDRRTMLKFAFRY